MTIAAYDWFENFKLGKTPLVQNDVLTTKDVVCGVLI